MKNEDSMREKGAGPWLNRRVSDVYRQTPDRQTDGACNNSSSDIRKSYSMGSRKGRTENNRRMQQLIPSDKFQTTFLTEDGRRVGPKPQK